MKLHQIIQKKRKELGLTQEQIANYLGVSTPAVNKWENGNSCPDIELLCPLARLLKVDVNELLGFREELAKDEISRILQRVAETSEKEGLDKGMKTAEEFIREYPNCAQLIYYLALTMEGQAIMASELHGKYEKTIYEWYVRSTESDDINVRNMALHMLAAKAINNKDFEKAQEYLDQLPEQEMPDKNLLRANMLLGKKKSDEAAELLERMVQKSAMSLQMYMMRLMDAEIQAGNIDIAKEIAEIRKKIMLAWDAWKYSVYVSDFEIAVETKNVDNSIKSLREMLKAIREPVNGIDSPLLYRMYKDRSDLKKQMTGEKFLPGLLNDLKTNPMFEFLRENSEFRELLEEAEK